jgi:hypothetical protein
MPANTRISPTIATSLGSGRQVSLSQLSPPLAALLFLAALPPFLALLAEAAVSLAVLLEVPVLEGAALSAKTGNRKAAFESEVRSVRWRWERAAPQGQPAGQQYM